jgi:outer membrane receptor for ferrienterochelin and colicin
MRNRLPLVLPAIIACMANGVVRGEAFDSLFDLSLEELLNVTTDIASNTGRPILEQPSIISVVTRDQIIRSGARDLLDVMRMIPGFGFAHDTLGINSWGFRGIWGHEGKIMLLVDGAPHNDAAWGNLIFGRRFPVELIARIEVIRGPGAAKFGNYAEMAVVRITTLNEDLEGGFVDINIRNMENHFSGAEFTGAYGETLASGFDYSVSAHVKNVRRTMTDFTSADGSLRTDQKHSPMDLLYLDGNIRYSHFNLSTLLEQFSFEHQESLLQLPLPDTVIDQGYRRFHLGVDYDQALTDNLSIDGQILYQQTLAHNANVIKSPDYRPGSHYGIDTERLISNVDGTWQLSSDASINVGIEYFTVTAIARATGDFFFDPEHQLPGDSSDNAATYYGDSNRFKFNQKSVFFQYENYNDWVNYTLGARWASHSATSKAVVVPRFGLSKTINDFGIKLMYLKPSEPVMPNT